MDKNCSNPNPKLPKKCCCFIGPRGPMGPPGPQGPMGSIIDSFDTLEELKIAHPVGNVGDSYLVDGNLYTWDEETQDWKNVGNLQGPEAPRVIRFSSIDSARLQADIEGKRSGFCAVGLGQNIITSTDDPIFLTRSAISIKTFEGGTITDLEVTLSLTLAATDLPGTAHAQLYWAPSSNSREFNPISNTLVSIPIEHFATVGTTYTASLSDLSENIPDGAQLILGFYHTSDGEYTSAIEAILSGAIKIK